MSRKNGGCIVMGNKIVTGAVFDGIPENIQRYARLFAEQQAFANDGGMGEPEVVGYQFDDIAGTQRAAADDATHRFENR